MPTEEVREVIRQLLDACRELMAELGNKRAADWGIINDAMVAGAKLARPKMKKCECAECQACREVMGR